jgi:hypothetical protein
MWVSGVVLLERPRRTQHCRSCDILEVSCWFQRASAGGRQGRHSSSTTRRPQKAKCSHGCTRHRRTDRLRHRASSRAPSTALRRSWPRCFIPSPPSRLNTAVHRRLSSRSRPLPPLAAPDVSPLAAAARRRATGRPAHRLRCSTDIASEVGTEGPLERAAPEDYRTTPAAASSSSNGTVEETS